MVSHRRYFLVLTAVYAVFWAALAIDPHDRGDWALENVLVVVAAVLLFFSYKRVLLSRISYTLGNGPRVCASSRTRRWARMKSHACCAGGEKTEPGLIS
jgi:hypothetical protein